jgi:hypothetical protein
MFARLQHSRGSIALGEDGLLSLPQLDQRIRHLHIGMQMLMFAPVEIEVRQAMLLLISCDLRAVAELISDRLDAAVPPLDDLHQLFFRCEKTSVKCCKLCVLYILHFAQMPRSQVALRHRAVLIRFAGLPRRLSSAGWIGASLYRRKDEVPLHEEPQRISLPVVDMRGSVSGAMNIGTESPA